MLISSKLDINRIKINRIGIVLIDGDDAPAHRRHIHQRWSHVRAAGGKGNSDPKPICATGPARTDRLPDRQSRYRRSGHRSCFMPRKGLTHARTRSQITLLSEIVLRGRGGVSTEEPWHSNHCIEMPCNITRMHYSYPVFSNLTPERIKRWPRIPQPISQPDLSCMEMCRYSHQAADFACCMRTPCADRFL